MAVDRPHRLLHAQPQHWRSPPATTADADWSVGRVRAQSRAVSRRVRYGRSGEKTGIARDMQA